VDRRRKTATHRSSCKISWRTRASTSWGRANSSSRAWATGAMSCMTIGNTGRTIPRAGKHLRTVSTTARVPRPHRVNGIGPKLARETGPMHGGVVTPGSFGKRLDGIRSALFPPAKRRIYISSYMKAQIFSLCIIACTGVRFRHR